MVISRKNVSRFNKGSGERVQKELDALGGENTPMHPLIECVGGE